MNIFACYSVNLCVDPDLDRCANGGTCTPNKDELFCECVPGFTGTYCDVDINNCAPNPCVHGNCTDLTHDYSCTCDTGLWPKLYNIVRILKINFLPLTVAKLVCRNETFKSSL